MGDSISCPFCGGEMSVTEFVLTSMPAQSESTARCSDCHASLTVPGSVRAALRILDGRLMPEGMTWPRWEDGEKVMLGDEFDTDDHHGEKVASIELFFDGLVCLGSQHYNSLDLGDARCHVPDTQERIDADVDKYMCEYWGVSLHTPCRECARGSMPDRCESEMRIDLLRRQRELDKREMCDGQN